MNVTLITTLAFLLTCLQTSIGSPLYHVYTALVTNCLHEEQRPHFAKTIGYLQETYVVFLKKLSIGTNTDSETRIIYQTVKSLSRITPYGPNTSNNYDMQGSVDMVLKLLYYKTLQYQIYKPASLNTPSTNAFDELQREVEFIDPYCYPVNESQVEYHRMQCTFLFDLIFLAAKTMTTDSELLGVVCGTLFHLSNLLNDVNMMRMGEKAAVITSHINCAVMFEMEEKRVVEATSFQAYTSANYTIRDIETIGLSTEYIKMATEQAYRRASSDIKVIKYHLANDPLNWYLSTSSNGLPIFTTRMVSELTSFGKAKMPSFAYFAVMHTVNVVNCLLHDFFIAFATFSSPKYLYKKPNTHDTHMRELAVRRVHLADILSNFPPESKHSIYGRLSIGALTGSAYYREKSRIHSISSNQFTIIQPFLLSNIIQEHFTKCSAELRVARLSGLQAILSFNAFVFDGSLVAMMNPAVHDYANVKEIIEKTILEQNNL